MKWRNASVGGVLDVQVERRADGSAVLRSPEALQPHPDTLLQRFRHWLDTAPERSFAARRDPGVPGGGDWRHLRYAELATQAQAIGQALLDRGLSAERPVAILSDNDLEHLLLAFGAMWAGIPVAPISPAYSLLSQDHAKLRFITGRITPGLVFASSPTYGRAIEAVCGPEVEVVLAQGELTTRRSTPFAELLRTVPGPAVAAAHQAVNADTIVKFLFTSGSTKQPKAVVNTHRMMAANQQMLMQTLKFLAEEPPVLVDWLPWNHTFGGNHNIGITLWNGGTLYIDEGKPTPQAMGTTLRNLRELAPTIYFNVPKGFDEIASAMGADDALRKQLFSRVQAFMFAGAGLSQAVWDRLDALAEATIGERIPIFTGLGMTETAPACTFAVEPREIRSGHIGLPVPGVEVKLAPDEAAGKTEVRFRGPNVMPGYWRDAEQTAAAFDEEGFFRTGDAVRWVEESVPRRGLMFDGRIAEDFKLSSGTFVSVGPLRARIIALGAPCVQDAVIAGLNREHIVALLFPRLDECARLAGLPSGSDAATLLAHPVVVAFFQTLTDRLWQQGTGSATRVRQLLVLQEPPHIDKGEITDKGSINQRAVLAARAALVDEVYAGRAPGVLVPRGL